MSFCIAWKFQSLLSLSILLLIKLPLQIHGQHFYGIAYSPYRRFGHCPTNGELSQDNVIGARYTTRVRLYSTECPLLNDAYLGAASNPSNKFKSFEVLMGLWIDGNPARDRKEIQDLYFYLRKYPNARLAGITVGNEVLYRRTMHPNALAQMIVDVKATVRQIGAETGSSTLLNVPVFSVDVIPHPAVVAVSDAVGANVHPFYNRVLGSHPDPEVMSDLALQSAILEITLLKQLYAGKELYVTETGWPSSSAHHEVHRGDLEVSKRYMQKFIAWAASQNLKYWWFELFDSQWKRLQFPSEPPTMSEFHWGFYTKDRIKKF